MYTRDISQYWVQAMLNGYCTGPAPSDIQGRLMKNDGPDRHFGRPGRRSATPSHLLLRTLSMHAFGRSGTPSGSLEADKLCASSKYVAQ